MLDVYVVSELPFAIVGDLDSLRDDVRAFYAKMVSTSLCRSIIIQPDEHV
jgi:thiamine pyrophosphokinase